MAKKIIDEGVEVDETSPFTVEDQCYQRGCEEEEESSFIPCKNEETQH